MTYGVFPNLGGPPGPPGPAGFAAISPKYLVGNVPNGDSATPYAADGFFYLPDPGDGSAIEAALALAATVPGDVHLRPGTYDLGAGAVATPLVVPEGVIVSGAGNPATTIAARQTGDQGVFQLPPNAPGGTSSAIIRDLRIVALDAGELGTGSIALVEIRGSGAKIQNVGFELQTNSLSALRCAVFVFTSPNPPVPLVALENVSAFCDTSTIASGTPTAGVLIEEGQVHASNVQCVGFDVGFVVDYSGGLGGALLFGSTVYAVNFGQYGFWIKQSPAPTNVCALRVHDAVASGSGAVPPLGAGTSAGFLIEAGYAVTIASSVILNAYHGVRVTPAVGEIVNVQVDDTTITLCTIGVEFNAGATDCSVSGCDIGDEFAGVPITSNIGVYLNSTTFRVRDVVIEGNSIRVTNYDATLADCCGVLISGVRQAFVANNKINQEGGSTRSVVYCADARDITIAGNVIEDNDGLGAVFVEDDCERVTVTGNTAICFGGHAMLVFGSRCTITGNTIENSTNASLTATIAITGGGRCTITGNTIAPSTAGSAPAIRVETSASVVSNNTLSLDTPPATAAIELTAASSNNVVLGNVCLTVPPVSDLGAGNEVAHNI